MLLNSQTVKQPLLYFLRKEVIQPHLPIRLPCYDFTPVIIPAFGGLFARGLYAQYEREGAAFVPRYKKLLRTTTVATAEDVAKVAGIDLTDKEFWRGALQTVAQQIDLVCGLLEEGKQ